LLTLTAEIILANPNTPRFGALVQNCLHLPWKEQCSKARTQPKAGLTGATTGRKIAIGLLVGEGGILIVSLADEATSLKLIETKQAALLVNERDLPVKLAPVKRFIEVLGPTLTADKMPLKLKLQKFG
jgi:hypothetical protein